MKPEDEEPFLSFLSAWVNDVPVTDRYRWIYQNNPHGKALTWVAVEKHTQTIVGCTSIFPRKIWIHDRVELGSIGADTYVDPLWRRKGIAEALHRYSTKGMQEHGIRLEMGFPLSENLGAFRKAGAYLPGNFISARQFISVKPFLGKVRLIKSVPHSMIKILDKIFLTMTVPGSLRPIDTEFFVSEFKSFDESFESLNNEIIPFFKICCLRDCSYLRWRFVDNPFRQYTLMKVERKEDGRLVGFVALEVSGDQIRISELFARPEDDILKALLIAIIRFGVVHSLQSVSMMINPEGPYSHNLASCKFRLNHSDRMMLEVLGYSGKDALESLVNWYIAYSDVDN